MDNPILDTVGDVASASEEFLRFVNSVSSPKVIKKSTKALLKSAEDQIEFISRYPDYDIQFINGVSNIRERTKEELLESAQTRELAKLIRKEKNFEDLTKLANGTNDKARGLIADFTASVCAKVILGSI